MVSDYQLKKLCYQNVHLAADGEFCINLPLACKQAVLGVDGEVRKTACINIQ